MYLIDAALDSLTLHDFMDGITKRDLVLFDLRFNLSTQFIKQSLFQNVFLNILLELVGADYDIRLLLGVSKKRLRPCILFY
jgi:hypothetical protein